MSELNLLPFKYKEKKNKSYKTKLTIFVIMLVLCLFAVGIFVPQIIVSKLRSDSTALKDEISTKQPILIENKKITADLANYKSYTDKYDTIVNQKILAGKLLSDLMTYIPKDVSLTGITYSNKTTVSFLAKTNNFNSVYATAANLETSVRFKECSINGIALDQSTQTYAFNINISDIGGDSNAKSK